MASMEKELLEDMLKERDEKIQSLVNSREKQDMQIEKCEVKMEEVQIIFEEELKSHQIQIEEMKKIKQEAQNEIDEFTRGMNDKNLSDYIIAMKVNNTNPTYVLRSQAQLCMAMHNMGILENQLTMVKEGCRSFVKSIREEMSGQVDDKCKLEVDLMSHLAILDKDSRSREEQMQEKLALAELEEEQLKRKAAEIGYKEDISELSEPDDGVEKRIEALQKQIAVVSAEKRMMEEDLRNVVEERQQIIDELEREGLSQQKTIKEFELQLEDKRRLLKGEVNEILQEAEDIENNDTEATPVS